MLAGDASKCGFVQRSCNGIERRSVRDRPLQDLARLIDNDQLDCITRRPRLRHLGREPVDLREGGRSGRVLADQRGLQCLIRPRCTTRNELPAPYREVIIGRGR